MLLLLLLLGWSILNILYGQGWDCCYCCCCWVGASEIYYMVKDGIVADVVAVVVVVVGLGHLKYNKLSSYVHMYIQVSIVSS